MDEDDTALKLSGQALRKQKLREYLAAKGKLRPPNLKTYLREDSNKPKKLDGNFGKTGNEKENQGTDPPRFKLAEKKPQFSAGQTRAPLQSARQFCASANVATQATGRSHFTAAVSTRPHTTSRAKPAPHNAVPGQAARLTAIKGPSIISLVGTCSKMVASARNCPNAATTGRPPLETDVHSRTRPITTAAARTGPITSALAKIDPITTDKAGPRPNTTTQIRTRSSTTAPTRTQPSTTAQTRTHSTTTVPTRTQPNTTTQSRTHSTTTVPTRTQPNCTAQSRARSATTVPTRTQPNTTAQSRTHSTTTVPTRTQPNTTIQSRTRSAISAQARAGPIRAAPSRTSHIAAAPSKPGLDKSTLTRAHPSIPAAASKDASKPISIASKRDYKPDFGSTLTKSYCSTLQKKAAPQPGKGGHVLGAAGSRPMTHSRRAEHGQSVLNKVSLNKPQAKSTQGPIKPVSLVSKALQPQRPNLKGAASQPSRTGIRSKASASHLGGAVKGQQVGALQRAVRQAVTELRKGQSGTGVHAEEAERESVGCGIANQRNPAPSGRVGLTDLQSEKELGTASERIGAVPSTVPRTAKRTCLAWGPSDLKTPARPGGPGPGPGINGTVPQSKRKLTAAQEERLQKLKEWREAKGISYKRPPMPARPCVRKTICVPEHYWTAMEEEEEAQSLVYNIDRSLADCIKLLHEGCSSEQVIEVLSRVPMANKFAKYWICQARLMEREGNLAVLPMFEEAVRVVREPVDDLRAVVFEILKKKEESAVPSEEFPSASEGEGKWDEQGEGVAQQATVDTITPKATGALIRGAKDGSSVVKYKITATPGGQRSQRKEPRTVDGQELRFFTPVRRSVRIQRSAPRYPAALQEHDPCVASFRDLLEESEGHAKEAHDSPLYVYRENEALSDQVHLQLW